MPTKDEQLREAIGEAGYNPNASIKPGLSGMGNIGALYTQESGVALNDTGKQLGYQAEKSNDPNRYRIGDYVYNGTGYQLVSNSPTDIVKKYVTSDAKPLQQLSLTDWFNAAGKAVLGYSGLPTNDFSGNTAYDIAGAVGTAAVGQALKNVPYMSLPWALGNFINSINEANQRYLDEYLNQDFNYQLAGEFVTDANGKTTFKPNYEKMKDAGSESGEAVKAAQNTDNTGVVFNGDNDLTFRVSPVFAQSDSYKNLINAIKDNYSELTEEQANEVVDQDTGKTRLQTLEDLVKSTESNYLYNVQTVKSIKDKAPTASDKALDMGVEVSKIGYQSENVLKETTVSIYNDRNEIEEVNAKEWLDSIASKDKIGRENYMLSLGNRIADKNISDDEKAVLYGQSMALYAASDSDGQYKGIYQKDWTDAIGSATGIFSGLPLNQFFGGTELTTFMEDELSSGLLKLGGTVAGVRMLSAASNMIEKGWRKITPSMSEWSGEGGVRLAKGISRDNLGEDASNLKIVLDTASRSAAQVGYQMLADAMYDTAKLIPYAITDNLGQYDFLKELQTDFVMDMLVTYGPGQYVEAMHSPKYERRVLVENTKTGEFEYKRPKDVKGSDEYKIMENYSGDRDVRMVEVTAEELIARRSKIIDKLSDSDAAIKVQEELFDKNAAMHKLAVQIRGKVDSYHYRKFLRYTNDIRQLTSDTHREFLAKDSVSKNWEDLSQTLKDTGETLKKFSKADWNYIKAVTNEHRFLAIQKEGAKDKEEYDNAEKTIKNFYKDGKNGVSSGRAKQLDKLMVSMRKVASDVLDFYVEKGLMTQEDVDELRSQPGYTEGMYLPMYVKGGVSVGGKVGQDRPLYKKVKNKDVLIKLDDLDNPLVSLSRYINNAMRAVAVNDRALAIREAASIAGAGIHVVSDDGDVLKEVKNLKSMESDFNKIYHTIESKVLKTMPTFKQWQEANDKLVLRSNAYKSAQKLSQLQEEGKELRRQLRNTRRKKPTKLDVLVENGAPKVFYHGSPTTGIKEFDISKSGSNSRTGEKAIFFTDDYATADREFSYERIPTDSNFVDTKGKKGKVYKRYLKMDNPLDLGILTDKQISELWKYASNSGQLDGKDAFIRRMKEFRTAGNDQLIKSMLDFEKLAQSKYDGVIARMYPGENNVKEYGVFDSKNILTQKDIQSSIKNAQALGQKVSELQSKIKENKQAQLKTTDDIKRYIGLVMKRAEKMHKGSPVKLDMNMYLNGSVTLQLKTALKSGNMVGEVQRVINQAVEDANPWVDPQTVIETRTERAAERYRKKVAKEMESQKKTLGDKFNMAVDRVVDKALEKITGEKEAELTHIDENGEPTTILSNHGQKDVIRYRLNGEEHHMKLSGIGAEQLVAEFYAPEFVTPKTTFGKAAHRLNNLGRRIAQGKRYLTTSADIARVLPNLARDWSRGVVSTGGQILISPAKFFDELSRTYGYSKEQTKMIQDALMLARGAIKEDTLTASMQMPRKNREKSMLRALQEPDGNMFTRFIYDFKAGELNKLLSRPQDAAESFTRKRAMDTAYYKELADSQSKGLSIEESIKRATEAAYFYGREATVNFYRRGALISRIAQQVPYLSQKFATLESFKYTYLDDPIGVTRSLEATVSTYAALIAIALSNEESRKKYYMLTEYDRSNNIIIPIDNGTIMTIPLDDTIAAFLTPYRRVIESINGMDPSGFYLCFADGLAALSPLDFSGFSEGDGFNIARGFDKLEAELVPTWAQPFLEMWKGRDLYYGSALSIDSDYTGALYDNWSPTPGELTTKGKNSQLLKNIADNTGIPQWILQNFLSEYGGNAGQYALNVIDKLGGATEEAQGGKEWLESVFKPFTGGDSDQAKNAFYDAINELKQEKKKVQGEIATLTQKIKGAAGQEKADLMNQRQKKITDYGIKVSDTLNQYLSAYEITGGLSRSQANQAWYLYKLYDDNFNAEMYLDTTSGDYYTDKAKSYNNKQASSLAASSGLDKLFRRPTKDYEDSYAYQAFKNTVYGYGAEQMAELASVLENTDDYNNSFTKLRSDVKKARSDAYNKQDYTTMSALAYNYDMKIANAIYPYLVQHGVAETLDKSAVMNYLKEWFIVPSEEMRTAKGKYVPNLGTDSEKSEAFKKQFIKKIFGVSGK